MRIRAPKDFWAGLIFVAIGAAFIVLASRYRYGTMHRMGPAMFPTLTGGLLAALGAAACSPVSGSSSAPPTTAPAAIQVDALPTNEAGVPLIARVNDDEITLPEYQRVVERTQQMAGIVNSPSVILQTMIQQSLIEQSAAQFNIVITPEEVEQELQGLIASAGGDEAWQQWLTANNYTEEELRVRDDAHLVEWATWIDKLPADEIDARIRFLKEIDYSIHYHTFTLQNFLALIRYMRNDLGVALTLTACADVIPGSNEFLVVLARMEDEMSGLGADG